MNPQVIGGVGEKNFGKQWRQGNRVYDGDGVATALEAHPVGNAGGYTNLYSVNVEGYNATLKQGRGGVQTAIQLCARDAKGPSTTNQPMTLAAYLLSTKESDQENAQKSIALHPERTEDLADTNRKEP